MDERMYWVAWSRFPRLGGRRLLALYRAFGSLEAAWSAPYSALADVPDFGPKLASDAVNERKHRRPEVEWEAVSHDAVTIVTWVDAAYPAPLRDLLDPPPVLYVMGELPEWSRAVAMVLSSRAARPWWADSRRDRPLPRP